MLIDPFTVIAQIINFAILAVALKYFLYSRVIEAMDRREASIASRLTEAEHREADARSEAERYRHNRATLDHERRHLFDEARDEVEEQRRCLLDRAREDVEDERKRWHRGLRSEQHELQQELQRRTAHEVVELSRRVLSDLARANLESDVISLALDHLAADDDARDALLGPEAEHTIVTVRTAFALDREQRDGVCKRLRDLGAASDQKVAFEQDLDLVVGVEFRSDGTAVSWNVTDYLDRLRTSLNELMADVNPSANDH